MLRWALVEVMAPRPRAGIGSWRLPSVRARTVAGTDPTEPAGARMDHQATEREMA